MFEENEVCEYSYYNDFYNSLDQVISYFAGVTEGFNLLYKASDEIIWEQLIVDPIQDTVLDYGFQKFFATDRCCGGCHAPSQQMSVINLIEQLPDIAFHLSTHVVVKAAATFFFPFIYQINNKYEITEIEFLSEPIKFFGISPLETVQSMKIISSSVLGGNSSVADSIDNFSYRDDYHQDRADDEKFNKFMQAYHNLMETVDAALHAKSEISAMYKYIDKQASYFNVYEYFAYRANLYLNTAKEENNNDCKVMYLRSNSTSFYDEEWSLNEQLSYLAIRAAALIPLTIRVHQVVKFICDSFYRKDISPLDSPYCMPCFKG